MNTKTIAFAVDKGGTGKTTATINTAAGLAARGYRVLAVDADQQTNLSQVLMSKKPDKSLYDAFMNENEPLPVYPAKHNLDIVPASHAMFGIGVNLIARQVEMQARGVSTVDYRSILALKLAPFKQEYDYILIDCPPSDNVFMFNALYAADSVLIVTRPEPFCVYGVQSFTRMMRSMKGSGNKGLRLAGILINDYEVNSAGHRRGEDALCQWAPDFVFTNRIRHSRPLYNASLARQDIFSYAPDSNGARDYTAFIDEFVTRT